MTVRESLRLRHRFAAVVMVWFVAAVGWPALSATAATHVVQPNRLLDTRNNTGGHLGRLAAGEVFQLVVAGAGEVPTAASAVALNVTAVNPQGDGFLSAWPCDGGKPSTSNLNFVRGQTVANSVIVGLDSGGRICLRSSVATDALADVSAWFDGSSPVVPLAPNRMVDTRDGVGFARRKLNVGEVLTIPVRNRSGVDNDAGSVVANITAVGPDAVGFLTAYPCDQPVPGTSNVNFDRGRDVPNSVVTALAANGSFCLTTSVATHVLVDLMGFLRGGSDSIALRPSRILDTRNGLGAPKGALSAPLSRAVVRVTGNAGVPSGAGAVVVNITSTDASADGFVTAYPCDRPAPNTSNLNLVRGRNVANLAVVPVANDGTICIAATVYAGGSVHLIADVMGWLPAEALPASVPTRFSTLPLDAPMPSGSDCARQVRKTAEVRPRNTAKNQATVTPAALGGPALYQRVDGNFSGTTDEIMQWAACKWGVDEDIVRGMAADESWWNDNQIGDLTSDSSVCAYGHPIGADGVAGQCPQSLGLTQLKWQFHQAAYPQAGESNAYQLDYSFAVLRSCYEGNETYLNSTGYTAGDIWGCVGLWNSGAWHSAQSERYVGRVKGFITERVWEQPRFLTP
jgi:hypothetical protein